MGVTVRDRSARTRGLTLIEVAISIGLFALIVVPIFGLFLSSRQSVAESRHHTTARVAIEHEIERMRSIANTDEAATIADFTDLAALLTDARPTFTVAGLPSWQGGPANGRIRVCLDETAQYFTNTAADHDDYFGAAPFTQVANPAYQLDLDASGTFSALGVTAQYRILPVRLEVFWGSAQSDPTWDKPKVAITTMIAPKLNFRRG
jgi:Tfp pilus assembly protein PilV